MSRWARRVDPPRRVGAETKIYRARRTLGCGPSEAYAKNRSVLLALDAELSAAAAGGPRDCRALPESAAAGLDRLEAMAHGRHVGKAQQSDWYRRLRRIGPTLMGIELDLETDDGRLAAETFGPYSIHAEFVDARGLCVLVLHDSGRAVTVTVADCHDKITIEGLLAGVGATPVHPIPSADDAAG